MKSVSMSGSLRGNVGKKDAKLQRNNGMIPCVMYGAGEQIHFITSDRNIEKIIFTPEVFILKIEIDGKEHTAVLKDIQYHPVNDKVLHVDFLEVNEVKPIIMSVPLRITGTSPEFSKVEN